MQCISQRAEREVPYDVYEDGQLMDGLQRGVERMIRELRDGEGVDTVKSIVEQIRFLHLNLTHSISDFRTDSASNIAIKAKEALDGLIEDLEIILEDGLGSISVELGREWE